MSGEREYVRNWGKRVGRVERRPTHTYRGLGCCDGDRGHLGVSLKLYIYTVQQ